MIRSARLFFASPVLILVAVLGLEGARTVCDDLVFTTAATQLSFWGRESYQPTVQTIDLTGQRLESLLQRSPSKPNYLAEQAYFLSWRGYASDDVAQRLAYNKSAAATQLQALEQRPAYRQGWAEMIEYSSRMSGGGEMLEQAQARFVALQPAAN